MMQETQPTSQSVRRLVLVADDKPALYQIVGRVLAAFGLVALPADDGAAAIAAVEARQGEVCGANHQQVERARTAASSTGQD